MFLFAYLGDRHQLFLVMVVHEIQKALLLRQPFGVQLFFLVLAFSKIEVEGLRIGEATLPEGSLLAKGT